MHPSLPTLTILCVVWKQTHHEMKLVPQGHTIMRAEFDSGSMRDKIEASHAAVLVLKWKQPVSIRPGAEGTAPQSDFNSHIKTDRVLLYYLHRLMQTPDFFLPIVCKHKYWIMFLIHVTKRGKNKSSMIQIHCVYCNRQAGCQISANFSYLFFWCPHVMCKCE